MAPTLDDAWAKVEWAHRHLIRLDELLEDFIDSQPYLVSEEVYPERRQRVITAHSPSPVPPEVPYLFGDLIHALHSALDYVVCALVESTGHEITSAHAFPIFPEERSYLTRAPQMLRHVPYEAISLIQRLQPYDTRKWMDEVTPENADRVVQAIPLMTLYRLSIEEKHRALLLATAVVGIQYVGHNRPAQEPSGVGFRLSPSYDKAYIYLPFDPDDPSEQFDPHFSSDVTLVKDGPEGTPVRELGHMLYNEVAHHVMTEVQRIGLLPLSRPRQLPFVWSEPVI